MTYKLFHNLTLSVCIVTYNQVKFIEQCLKSIIEQDCDFNFEIIIGDDFSSDGTSEIITNYASKYPNIIKAYIHIKNIGAVNNYMFVHAKAIGRYVAHIDGDDYALPGKLKSQVVFLDNNSKCSMVFHRCLSLHIDGSITKLSKDYSITNVCDFAEFTYRFPSASCHSSKMYRKSASYNPKNLWPRLLDKHFHFEHGLSGLVGFLNEDLGVYRVGVGISSNIYAIHNLALDSYEYAVKLGYDKFLINKIIAREYFEQGLRGLQLKDFICFKDNVQIGFELGHKTKNSLLAYHTRNCPILYITVRNVIRWFLNIANKFKV